MALVVDEMKKLCSNLLSSPHPESMKQLQAAMIPTRGCKVQGRCWLEVDERCKLFAEEFTDDDNDEEQ